jgi:hypothetical protein
MSQPEESKKSEKMPRGAIATVIVGLIVTLGVVAIDLRGGSGTAVDVEWDTVEVVKTPEAVKLGQNGSFELARTSLAAIAPIASGQLLFRVAGIVSIDSGGKALPTGARCDITSPADSSRIAQTPRLRAAWPRPSIELQVQEVPEASVAMFKARGADALFLPIRDVFGRFTDSVAPTDLDWDGFEEQTQNWVWTMPEGTGPGTATLGYGVIFRTEERPKVEIRCSGFVGDDDTTVEVEAVQKEWPLEAPEPEEVDPDSAPADTTTETAPAAE